MIITRNDLKENLGIPGKLSEYIAGFLYRFCRIQKFNDLYEQYKHIDCGLDFTEKILASQNISISYDREKIEAIKAHKALIILSNHPHGILDGLLLIKLLGENGAPQTKVVANPLLATVKPLSKNLIIVNSFDDSNDHQLSFRGCRDILKAFKEDNFIVFFPAADVSVFKLKKIKIEDPAWNKTFFKVIEKTDCAILPIFIKGSNSLLYQILGLIHSKLCLLDLIPEFFRTKNLCIEIKIGDIFFKENISRGDWPDFLRNKVYELNR